MKTSQILAIVGFSAFAMAQSSSYSLAPSPTESYLCESHGDHWHCEGARSTTGAAGAATTLTSSVTATTTATEDHDHDDHDHSGTGVLPPSPTESSECVAHNDHWHCEGPASTAAAGNATVTTTTAATTTAAPSGTDAAATSASGAAASSTDVPAGAARVGFGAAAIAAALMAF